MYSFIHSLIVCVPSSVYMYHMHAGPEKGIRYPGLELQGVMSFLEMLQGTKYRSSGKAGSICNHWAISPSLHGAFLRIIYLVAGKMAQ